MHLPAHREGFVNFLAGRFTGIVCSSNGVLIINIISNENAKSISGVTFSSVIAAGGVRRLIFIGF